MVDDRGLATENRAVEKSPAAFRTISEVATELNVPQHVLRFWESKFSQIKPLKRAGGRRYYRPEDVDLLQRIRTLLYGDGYTIKGVQKLLRERGVRSFVAEERGEPEQEPETEIRPAALAADPGPTTGAGPDKAVLQQILDELLAIRAILVDHQR